MADLSPNDVGYTFTVDYGEKGTITYKIVSAYDASTLVPGGIAVVDGSNYSETDASGSLRLNQVGLNDDGTSRTTYVTKCSYSYYVVAVGKNAFAGNEGIYSVTFSQELSGSGASEPAIEQGAFKGCTNLTSVSFSRGVGGIGVEAFSGCTSLSSVSFAENSKLYRKTTVLTGVDIAICANAFAGCTSLTSIKIPAITTSTRKGDYYNAYSSSQGDAVSGYQGYWHDGLFGIFQNGIAVNAFSSCVNLEEIVFAAGAPQGARPYWGRETPFAGCLNLKSVIYESAQAYFGNPNTSLQNKTYCEIWPEGADATLYYAVNYYYTYAKANADEKSTAQTATNRIARVEYAAGTPTDLIATSGDGLSDYAYADASAYASTSSKYSDGTILDPKAAAVTGGLDTADSDTEWVWMLTSTQSRRSGLTDSCSAYLVRADDLSAGRIGASTDADQIDTMYKVADQNLSRGLEQNTAFDAERYYSDSYYEFDQAYIDPTKTGTNLVNIDEGKTPWFTLSSAGLDGLLSQITLYDGQGNALDLSDTDKFEITFDHYDTETFNYEPCVLGEVDDGPVRMTVTPLEGSGYDTSTCLMEWLLVKGQKGSILERYSTTASGTWQKAVNSSGDGSTAHESFETGTGHYAVGVSSADPVSALAGVGLAALASAPVSVVSSEESYGLCIALSGNFNGLGVITDVSKADYYEADASATPADDIAATYQAFKKSIKDYGAAELGDTVVLVNPSYIEEVAAAAATFAYAEKAPILYTDYDGTVSKATLTALKDFTNIVVIADEKMVSASALSQLNSALSKGASATRLAGDAGSACAFSIAAAQRVIDDGCASAANIAIVESTSSDIVTDVAGAIDYSGNESGIMLVVSGSADAKRVAQFVRDNRDAADRIRLFGRGATATGADGFNLRSALGQTWNESAASIPAIARNDTRELYGVEFTIGANNTISAASPAVRYWGALGVEAGTYAYAGKTYKLATSVSPGKSMTVTAESYSGVYDGKTHGAAATASITKGTTIYYSTELDESGQPTNWTKTYPTVKAVTASTPGIVEAVKVYVKAENPACATAECSYTLKVDYVPVTITAHDASKVYGEDDPRLETTVEGLLTESDITKITFTVKRAEGEDAGTYPIVCSYGSSVSSRFQGNYAITCVNGTFTIDQAQGMTVTGVDYKGTYDGKAHGSAAVANITEGTTLEYSTDAGDTWTTAVPQVTQVADSTDVLVRAVNRNYVTAQATYNLTVLRKSIEVAADDKTSMYGESDPTWTATVTGLVNGDELDVEFYRDGGLDVGQYTIYVAGAAQQGSYQIAYKTGTLTIAKSNALTVFATDFEGDYDGHAHGVAALPSVIANTTVSYSTDGGATWSAAYPTATDVCSLSVIARAENPNYETAETAYTLRIDPKSVTVTANDASKTYGTSDPAFSAVVAGTLGADTVSYTIGRATGENVGDYAITPQGEATQGNYAVTFVPGTLRILSAGALVVNAESYAGTYDGAAHGGPATPSVTDGTTLEYSTDGGQTWSEDYPTATNVADSVSVVVRAETPNYTAATASYALTVSPKNVQVAAADASKEYAEADPDLEATVTGLVDEEDEIAYELSREAGESVGVYAITATGEADQGNYYVSFSGAVFTIGLSSKLAVEGASYEGVYDGAAHGEAAVANVAANTTVTYSTDGGQTWSTGVARATNVADSCTVLVRAQNPNYVDATGTYTLEITQREVTITAIDNSKMYGESDPLFSVDIDNVVEGDSLEYRLERQAGEDVGTYVVAVRGEADQGNYAVTFVEGTFTIEPSTALALTVDSYSGAYDGLAHGAAARANVVENTTIEYSSDGGTTWTSDAPTVTDVADSRFFTARAQNPNYVTATVFFALTVTPRAATVTAGNATKPYGEDDPEFTATVEGLLNDDAVAYTFTRDEGEDVGSYEVMPTGDAVQGNYALTFESGTLTIVVSSALTVTGTDYAGTYDGAAHGEAALPSVTEGTKVSYSTDAGKTWSTTVPQVKNVADSATVMVKAENANYSDATCTYKLTVTQRPATVKANDASKSYAEDDPTFTATVSGTVAGDALAYTLTRESGESAGSYAIKATGAASQGNYSVSFENGTLTITRRSVTPIVIGSDDTDATDDDDDDDGAWIDVEEDTSLLGSANANSSSSYYVDADGWRVFQAPGTGTAANANASSGEFPVMAVILIAICLIMFGAAIWFASRRNNFDDGNPDYPNGGAPGSMSDVVAAA